MKNRKILLAIFLVLFSFLGLTSCKSSLVSNITSINPNEEYNTEELALNKKCALEIIETTISTDVTYVIIGRNTCPYCKLYVPAYSMIFDDLNIELNYFDVKEINVETYDDEGKAIYKYSEYKTLVEYLNSNNYAIENGYMKMSNFNNNGIKSSLPWLYVPRLYKMQNGKIIGQLSVEEDNEQDENGFKHFSKKQANSLISKVQEFVKEP